MPASSKDRLICNRPTLLKTMAVGESVSEVARELPRQLGQEAHGQGAGNLKCEPGNSHLKQPLTFMHACF